MVRAALLSQELFELSRFRGFWSPQQTVHAGGLGSKGCGGHPSLLHPVVRLLHPGASTYWGGNENRSVPPALRGWRCDADISEHEGPHGKQFGAVVTVVLNAFDLTVGKRCFVGKNGLCILTSALVA